MKELTTKEQYEYFEETFNKFNTTLLNQSDDDIEYIIFEDIIDNVVSFLASPSFEIALYRSNEEMISLPKSSVLKVGF